jgi:hypothetical protein
MRTVLCSADVPVGTDGEYESACTLDSVQRQSAELQINGTGTEIAVIRYFEKLYATF